DKGLIAKEEVFINEAQNGEFEYDFLKGIPEDRPNRLEGYLFPDTYEFKSGTTEHEIIDKMLGRFQEIFDEEISGKLGDRRLDDLIIMASIVEREAKVESERPIIAAVFYNRLKIDMQLQSCATIQYILGTNKERLLYEDLEIESPYNTYLNSGLPLGPICSPGRDSLVAALEPADVDYLYFVLKKYDGDGSHNFARNYNDFLKYKNQLK
ncbi:MAG: mltG, partial [Clostridiales bacterium]|nr:mltG [Clostridiales bacterium]